MANQFFKNWEVTLKHDGHEVIGKGGDILQCLKKIREKADLDKIKLFATFQVTGEGRTKDIYIRFNKAKLKMMFLKNWLAIIVTSFT